MPDLAVEEDYVESDTSDNEERYSKLLSSVSQLDSTQRVKPASRKEVASEVSEYNLTKGTPVPRNLVNVKELAAALRKKSAHVEISKKVKKVAGKAKTLPKPLEKPVEERLKRSVGFEKVKNELRKWDAIVTRNSLRDRISFPLKNDSVKIHDSSDFLEQFKTTTPLETEIAKILKKESKPNDEEKTNEFPLTVEEMLEKRKEMAQLRARLSYSQAKAQRQSKIKSKKYHRILKREKLRQQLKEFEILQKTDPEAALKKLSELDKSRAQERASLRHRNTGQWAKNLSVRAKYDVESRKVLAEQLKMSREITQKVHELNSSDEDEEESKKLEGFTENHPAKQNSIPSDNPWSLDVSEEVNNFVRSYKKYWNEQNKETNQNKMNEESDKRLDVEKVPEEIIPENSDQNVEDLESKKLDSEMKNTPQKEKTSELESLPDVVPKKGRKRENTLDVDSSPPKEKKKMKKTSTVNINPTSGVWIVTPVTEKPESDGGTGRKRKSVEIDNLFSDLDDRLRKKAEKKAVKMQKKLKKLEKIRVGGEERKERNEFDLTLKNVTTVERPDMDVELSEGVDGESTQESNPAVRTVPVTNGWSEPPPEIDPKKFIQVNPKKLKSQLPESITGGEDALDDEDEETQQKAIEEAFSGDDVTAEFKKLKQQEEESNQVVIQKSLPGWGSWGGEGVKPPSAKKSTVRVKPPRRKDEKREDIIINENENPKIKEHLVKEVPHPFKSVEAFEANIRAPVGRDWVPETAHRKLIQKQVTTQLGAVIEPMDDDEIIKLKARRKTPYKGKVKEKKK